MRYAIGWRPTGSVLQGPRVQFAYIYYYRYYLNYYTIYHT